MWVSVGVADLGLRFGCVVLWAGLCFGFGVCILMVCWVFGVLRLVRMLVVGFGFRVGVLG